MKKGRTQNMKLSYVFKKHGFSLVEIMIAIMTASIIMTAIMMSVKSGLQSSVGIDAKTTTQQNTRAALEMMALEIGMASYNPRFVPSTEIWADLTTTAGQNCSVLTSAPANPEWRGIREATASSLTIEADINDDGIIGSTGQPNEVVRYVYVTAGGEQYITRCTCCTTGSTGGGGQPFLGGVIASAQARTVRVINNTEGIPVFRYFNALGAEFTPNPALTICNTNPPNAHICNIRRIDITLAAESDTIDPMTKQRHKQFYSLSVTPRNHGINP